MTPTGLTELYGVIGSPIGHSLSPVMFNAAFDDQQLNKTYLAFDIEADAVPQAIRAMRVLPICGLSVTMPLKAVVVDHLDSLSPTAQRLGAVNCIVNDDGQLIGHSTDGAGLVDTLRVDEGVDPAGKTCVVLGAGGAARAAVLALAEAGAQSVVVVNRTLQRAEAAAALAGSAGRVGNVSDVQSADLVIQATPVGMSGNSGNVLGVQSDCFHVDQVVFDMIYEPAMTPLMEMARERGARSVGGLGMLVHQGAQAFRLFTGLDAPVERMKFAAHQALARRGKS